MKREEKTKRVEYIFKKTNHKECLNRILFPTQKHFSYKKLGKHRCFHVISLLRTTKITTSIDT